MTTVDSYSDAKTARLYVVDELLRSPQGGTYEEMLQKVFLHHYLEKRMATD